MPILLFLLTLARLLRLTTGEGGEGDPKPQPQKNIEGDFAAFVEQHGGSYEASARHLWNDNFGYRSKNAAATTELESLRTRVPSEGSVVLSKEAAAQLEAYKALGTPDDLKQGLVDRDTAKGELATLRKDERVRAAASAAGFDFDVLKERLGELLPEVREVEQDGTKKPVAYVKDGATEVLLTEYAKQHWPKYLPALTVATTQQPAGTFLPPQTGAGGAGGDPVDDFVKNANAERAAKPNPLAPRTA